MPSPRRPCPLGDTPGDTPAISPADGQRPTGRRGLPPGEGPAARRWPTAVARAAGSALALAVVCGAAGAAEAFGIAELTAVLSRTQAGEATFTERRQVMVNDRPLTLESSGRLSFEAPDTFVRETLKPRPERVAVVGNQLTMSQGTRSRTMALDAAPEAGLIVEAIRGTLTGNRASLERHFDATVSGNAERWALQLVPREPRLREQLASVRIAGQQGLLREVQLAMPDGDRSTMTIQPIRSTAKAAADTASGAAR